MSISDNGDGFSQKDIINLGNIGESDKKSTFDKIKRKNGDFYAGNKGLGILSSFSLSDIIEITTNNENHSYIINWERSQGYFEYTEINLSPKTGARLLIKEINPQDMKVLIDEEEFSKMRHAIISHFTNNNKIKIKLYIDNVESSNLSCCNINELDDLFIYKVDFMYNSKKNTLELSFLKANPPLKKGCSEINTDKLYKKLTIPLLNDLDINNLLKETYYLTKTYIPNNTNFKYLDSNLEDFNGSLFITEGAPPKTFKETSIIFNME